MISAKDYYYRSIAPEENGLNYQQVHQSHIYSARESDEDTIKILSHVPWFSNDLLIEEYVSNLLNNVDKDIGERIKEVFIAKRKNYFPNAGAVHAKEAYSGDLVFFYVGLSDVLFQYAILFTEFIELKSARTEHGDNSAEAKKLFFSLCKNITSLSEAQIEWGINRNEIRFKDTALLPDPEFAEKTSAIAMLMDKAVIRHELAHHFLGHTGDTPVFSKLANVVVPFLNGKTYSDEHRREIGADIGGIYLPYSCNSQDSQQVEETIIDVVLGTLLMQTTLAQLKGSIFLDTTSHPSWYERYTLTLKALSHFYQSEFLEDILKDVTRFQVLLFGVQQRGLGELNKKISKVLGS